MKKILFVLSLAGIAWWAQNSLRRHREVVRWWSIAEREASQEIDSGETTVFVEPVSMFRTGN
jgi:hypothetical protein